MIKKTIEYIKIPKKVFFTVLIGIVALTAFWMLKPQKHFVDVVTINKGLFLNVIDEEGFTQFKSKEIIHAPADGITPAINFKVGDAVKQNQVLISFKWDQLIQIKAPFDGIILNIFEKDQRHVPRGTPLLEIGNNQEVEIVAKVLSEEVVAVEVGQKVIIKNWGKDQHLEGIVSKIANVATEEVSALGVKEQRVKVFIKIKTPREVWKDLGEGYRVEVQIVLQEKANATLLPVGTIFSDQNRPAIFLLEKNRIKKTLVQIGAKNDHFAELFTQLPEQAQVVLYPGPYLEDGMKVKIR